MLLTAQRVRDNSGNEGVNAFCYLHGACDWPGEPPSGVPDSIPGKFVNKSVTVEPGGNRVRSYLDIIAPDDTPTTEIIAAIPSFLASTRESQLPWVATVGRCTFRFGLDYGLETTWDAEFRALLEAALRVRLPF